jgi:hypothetical protein
MAVKKKAAGVDPKEIQEAFDKSAAETKAKEEARKKAEGAATVKDKKTTKKRVEQVLKNDMVKVEVADANIPIEHHHVSVTAVDGLMDYIIAGTHLRLLCMADPSLTPTTEQRVAMARRLNEVGPFLPRYIKSVSLTPKAGKALDEVPESVEETKEAFGLNNLKHQPKPATDEPVVSRTSTVRKIVKEKTAAAPALVNGVPLKKLCSEVDIDPKDARMILRKKKVEKPGGRWEWAKDEAEKVKAILVAGKADL